MSARIYKPAKTAMQSGRGRTKLWVLEFDMETPPTVEPLMGWTSSTDTRRQVRLSFDTREEAVAYAERKGIAYTVTEPQERSFKPVSYSDNFKAGRKETWTH